VEAIIAACITGVLALIGVILTCRSNNRKIEQKLQTAQAVTDTKLDNLTREVRMHNGFATEIPVLKREVELLRGELEKLKQYHTERV
jgi:cell shape-determining protein MreC